MDNKSSRSLFLPMNPRVRTVPYPSRLRAPVREAVVMIPVSWRPGLLATAQAPGVLFLSPYRPFSHRSQPPDLNGKRPQGKQFWLLKTCNNYLISRAR